MSNDATLPDFSTNGIPSSTTLSTNVWQCFEYHLDTDSTVETWLDSTTIPGLTVGPALPNNNAQQWERGAIIPKTTGVYFDWESYSGDINTFWYDDIAVDSKRVGCLNSTAD